MYYDFAYFLEEYLDSGVFLLNLVTSAVPSVRPGWPGFLW